jgi:hypothetical protein
MKKVVSFALFGKKPIYLKGMLENVVLCKEFYPDWVCRVYVSKDVPTEEVFKLTQAGAEIVWHYGTIDFKAQWVRMEVALDEYVGRFIIRDADSRINKRERDAVKEWEESGKLFHIMRDHKKHTAPIMGGMWGAVSGFIPRKDFRQLYRESVLFVRSGKSKRKKYYKANGQSDQGFLGNKIWPLVKSPTIHIAHDIKKRFTKEEINFKVKLPYKRFVGQQVSAEGKYISVN